jgi:hypothetical protein
MPIIFTGHWVPVRLTVNFRYCPSYLCEVSQHKVSNHRLLKVVIKKTQMRNSISIISFLNVRHVFEDKLLAVLFLCTGGKLLVGL